jgi:uncharacterized membrane protein
MGRTPERSDISSRVERTEGDVAPFERAALGSARRTTADRLADRELFVHGRSLARRLREARRRGEDGPTLRRPGASMLAIETYEVLKFFHVLFAIVAVGFNASYGIWLARAARERDHEAFALRGVKLLDDRFANPAYGLLLVTGLLMVWVGDLDLSQFWLLTALVLYALAVGLGLFLYTPTLRDQIRVLATTGPDSAEFVSLSKRGTTVGIVLAIDVIVIVFLMVTKPTL